MANRTISDTGGNWKATTAWVEGAVPTSSDAVIATATSGPLSIFETNGTTPATDAVCASMDLTGYIQTLTAPTGSTLTVYGNVTFVGTMETAGTGTLVIGNGVTTSTIVPVSRTWRGALTLAGTGTKTLEAALTVTGAVTISASCLLEGGGVLTCAGIHLAGTLDGDAELALSGGTWSATTNSNLGLKTTFAGNVTVSGTVYYGMPIGAYISNNILAYSSGTVTTAGSTLVIANDCEIYTPSTGMSWNNVTLAASLALGANISIAGVLTTSAVCGLGAGSFTTTVSGGFTGTKALSITGTLALTGGTVTSAEAINGAVTISGTTTIGNLMLGAATLTCTSGNVTVTPGTTLTLTDTATLTVTAGLISWQNVAQTETKTITLTNATMIQGNVTVAATKTATWNTGIVYLGGTITFGSGSGSLSGSSVITPISNGGLSLTIT